MFGNDPQETVMNKSYDQVWAAERVTSFLRSVYGWMCAGLAITALFAYVTAGSPLILQMLRANRLSYLILVICELGLVFYLSARVDKMTAGTASLLFIIYSALNGVTLSVIFLIYTKAAIFSTFAVTGAMFGVLALYGTVTRRNLAGWGQFFIMGLVGLLLATVVSIFWANSMLNFVISVLGVIVFTGLTVWDANRLRQMALVVPEGRTGSYAIVGALALYLDFINLFLFLLRLFGRRD